MGCPPGDLAAAPQPGMLGWIEWSPSDSSDRDDHSRPGLRVVGAVEPTQGGERVGRLRTEDAEHIGGHPRDQAAITTAASPRSSACTI